MLGRAFAMIRQNLLVIVALCLPAMIVVEIVRDIAHTEGLEPSIFVRDLAAIGGFNPLYGFISTVGILLWMAAAAICFFTAGVILKYTEQHRSAVFLICSGLFASLLMLDDQFMFHEYVFKVYLHVSEKRTYAAYILLMAAYFIVFRREILRTNLPLLVVAGGFFALSIVADEIPDRYIPYELFEEGTKFVGIVCWLGYFVHTSLSALRPLFVGVAKPVQPLDKERTTTSYPNLAS